MTEIPVIVRKGTDPLPPWAINTLAAMLKEVRYGSITLVVQNGKLAQIDKTEKFRLNRQDHQ
ncbi:YezD family protein [Geotalea sp. SG265]|uniref:YezD family protein n=1 Tax=Geotalea sp. SG265 TaxID=2922867 RepID=UPI001FAE7CF0|nr:YezD family protein [Geotalea sp. SG265]